MAKRIDASGNDVAVTLDGVDGVAARAQLLETTPQGSAVRSVDLILRGLPNDLVKRAMEAMSNNRLVRVRVLGFEASWLITRTLRDDRGVVEFYLKQSGPVAAVPTGR